MTREPARIIGHIASAIILAVVTLLEGGWPGWAAITAVVTSAAIEAIHRLVTPVVDPRDTDGRSLFAI